MEGVIDKDQRLSEGRVEAEDGKLDFEESSDDTEVEFLLPRKGSNERDPPDIRGYPRCAGGVGYSAGGTGFIWSLCMGLGRNGTGRDDPHGPLRTF